MPVKISVTEQSNDFRIHADSNQIHFTYLVLRSIYAIILFGSKRRGVREVYGAALEKRCCSQGNRGFESHPLRHLFNKDPFIYSVLILYSNQSINQRQSNRQPGRDAGVDDQARLESACSLWLPWVRIPLSPPTNLSALIHYFTNAVHSDILPEGKLCR